MGHDKNFVCANVVAVTLANNWFFILGVEKVWLEDTPLIGGDFVYIRIEDIMTIFMIFYFVSKKSFIVFNFSSIFYNVLQWIFSRVGRSHK